MVYDIPCVAILFLGATVLSEGLSLKNLVAKRHFLMKILRLRLRMTGDANCLTVTTRKQHGND